MKKGFIVLICRIILLALLFTVLGLWLYAMAEIDKGKVNELTTEATTEQATEATTDEVLTETPVEPSDDEIQISIGNIFD